MPSYIKGAYNAEGTVEVKQAHMVSLESIWEWHKLPGDPAADKVSANIIIDEGNVLGAEWEICGQHFCYLAGNDTLVGMRVGTFPVKDVHGAYPKSKASAWIVYEEDIIADL